MTESDLYTRVVEFLNKEAELLDDGEWEEWLERMVTDDIEYKMPVRVTREAGEDVSEFSNDSYHMIEDKETLKDRVKRFDMEHAWAHNPRPRLRHIVSNVRVSGGANGEYDVKSNFIFYRNQGEYVEGAYESILSGEREDKLREENDELKIAKRIVKLDQTDLKTKDMSFLL